TGLEPTDLDGILVTHEHSDHVKSLRVVTKKSQNASVYSNINTWQQIRETVPEDRQIVFESGKTFVVGDIQVKSFATSHDAAEPVGFSFYHEGKQVSIVTDTGYISEEVFQEIKGADLLALEANHDVNILQFCRYPYHIKRRILGDQGHLSNEAAGECICRLLRGEKKARRILLSHLSRENNTPDMAKITVTNILEDAGLYPLEGLSLSVLMRDQGSPLYMV
ncbi:MAG: MBL fold metallo-hydrolase, partial [Anaerovoracaceae bacterium]